MARSHTKKRSLPAGERAIMNVGIARTRYTDDFEAADGQRGQFYELIQRVGVRLVLPRGDAPYLVPGQPLTGKYEGGHGTRFQINRAALFTNTSKMPGVSFAISAGPPAFGGTCAAAALGERVSAARAQLQARLPDVRLERQRLPVLQGAAEGDFEPRQGLSPGVLSTYNGDPSFVCRMCYALAGNYNYPSKQVNDMMHLAWVEYELAHGGPQRLGTALAYAIQHANLTRAEGFQPYFRIHDAGDFHTPEYLEAWVVCASLMTHMRFWAPTRMWVFPKWVKLLQQAEQRVRAAGGWLVIRPSVLRVGEAVPRVPGMAAGSGVGSETADPCIWVCPVYNKLIPKPQPDGTVHLEEAASCLEANCTMCWDQPAVAVTYGAH